MGVPDLEEAIAAEKRAVSIFKDFVKNNARDLRLIADWGSGECSYMAEMAAEILLSPRVSCSKNFGRKKKAISAELRRQVLERDAYRCICCGTWKDLTCDHTIPESKGGLTNLGNLRAMCKVCNCKKGVSHG